MMGRRILSILLSLNLIAAGFGAFAKQSLQENLQADKIKIMVTNYYLQQIQATQTAQQSIQYTDILTKPLSTDGTDSHLLDRCDPDQDHGVSCVEILCKSTNCYGSTGQEIAMACVGSNGRCVQQLCKSTNCYGSTGKEIAMACKRSSGLCVEELCKSTNCYGSTGKEIAQACEGSDGRCVVELCKSTNCYGSTGKDIAKSCAGR